MRDAAPACSLARALARKPRQRRNTRGEKHKERREEPEQSTRRHHEANGPTGESIASMKIASVVGSVQPLLARAGCSKMPRKSFPNRSRKLPGSSRSSLWPSWGSFCPSWGSFGASWGSFWTSWGSLWASWGAPGALLGRSGEPLGSLWGASWASKSLPNRSRRLSRRPPAPQLDFGSILGAILGPFGDPPDLEKPGFRVESVAFFEKSRGSKTSSKLERF